MKENMKKAIKGNDHLAYSWSELNDMFECVIAAKIGLSIARTSKEIRFELDNLTKLMDKLSKQNILAESIAEISTVIRRVRLHDATRTELCNLLEKLFDDFKKIFKEEQRKNFSIAIGLYVLNSISS